MKYKHSKGDCTLVYTLLFSIAWNTMKMLQGTKEQMKTDYIGFSNTDRINAARRKIPNNSVHLNFLCGD